MVNMLQDTAGVERFRTLTPSYYRNAQGAIVVYDVTRRDTFNKMQTWLDELDTYSTKRNIVKMIVGNKIDKVIKFWWKLTLNYLKICQAKFSKSGIRIYLLLQESREVSREEGIKFAKRHSALYVESSAKTRDGVECAFEELVQKVSPNRFIPKILFLHFQKNCLLLQLSNECLSFVSCYFLKNLKQSDNPNSRFVGSNTNWHNISVPDSRRRCGWGCIMWRLVLHSQLKAMKDSQYSAIIFVMLRWEVLCEKFLYNLCIYVLECCMVWCRDYLC